MTLNTKLNAIAEALTRRLGTLHQLDAPSDALAGIADKSLGAPVVRDALSGSALGHPLHPVLVAVPIGAFAGASLLDITGDSRASKNLIAAGMACAIPAAAAGLSDWRYTSGVERRTGFVHATANSVALGFYAASLLARRRGGGKLLALTGFGLLGFSGYLGGHLAYALGVGVDTNAFSAIPTDWMPVADVSEITDELTVVPVNGTNVLVTRVDGEVVAIANRCSHRGAPLSDGDRQDNCVVCPWHESTFALKDGAVVNGPAVRPQKSFDVKVEGDKVLIRHRDDDSDLSANVDAAAEAESKKPKK